MAFPRVPHGCVSPSQDSPSIEITRDGQDEVLPCKDNAAFQGKKIKRCGVDPVLEQIVTLSSPQPQGTAEVLSIFLG